MYSKAFLSVLDICALSYLYILEMRNVTILFTNIRTYVYIILLYTENGRTDFN